MENVNPNEVLAIIVKEGEDFYVVDQVTGEKSGPCKFCDENDKTIVLPANSANRHWANRAKVDAAIAENGQFDMVYKATKKVGSYTSKLPNEKLISYLSEDMQAEYKAIIDRAREAMEADKAKPKTEVEKAQEKLARAQAALEKLLKQAEEVAE